MVKQERFNSSLKAVNLVEEVPVAFTINDINYSIMLSSPYDLEDFAFGLLLTEGIITNKTQVHDIQISEIERGIQVNVVLANRQLHEFKIQQRQLRGTSGCGLCGKEAMEYAFPQLPKLEQRPCLPLQKVAQLKNQLEDWQKLAKHSGAMHAAFWIDDQGDIQACREDIGRHNAVDKLIGYAISSSLSLESASILVTSRCSVEIVQKVIRCGVASLISLASPTQLAVSFAIEHNLNLVHIPKADMPHVLTLGK